MTRFRPTSFAAPEMCLDENLSVSAFRFPDSAAIHFYGTTITYAELDQLVDRLCGWLQDKADVTPGTRVGLYMQNSPQWLMSFYAVLRAGGIVVPISPMNRAGEIEHYLADSGASVLIAAADLLPTASAALTRVNVATVLVVEYADYISQGEADLVPAWLMAQHDIPAHHARWQAALDEGLTATVVTRRPDDICALPYTSGSTGKPKACMHTHRSLMHTAAGMTYWHGIVPGDVSLGMAPMYHVSGLCHAVTAPIYAGAAVAIVPRWDRTTVLDLIERYGVTHASLPPTAVIDMLNAPDIRTRNISSIRRVSSGGSAMPEPVWKELRESLQITFLEAYGMTETAATTHLNPPEAPRPKCLGLPFFGTSTLIVDPDTLAVLPVGESGEIVIAGPQLFKGYWNREEDTAKAFITIEGRRYLRSGDIGYADADGYYYMTDRAKRMINASGLKVWPSEIENYLHAHPSVLEACVIASPDAYRGETVKALVVLRQGADALTDDGLIAWCKERMAAYKYPRIVEFVEHLPKSPAGKILWRDLQDKEMGKAS